VLISGYRNDADIWDTIALAPDADQTAVLPGVATFTRVCAYDRPGTMSRVRTSLDATHFSRSDPIPMPRTARDVVADLHALLEAAAVPEPYVLVGHSFGGLFSRLYAATYPDEVVGLVMVDALAEGIQPLLSPDEWEHYQRSNNQVPPGLENYHALETLDWAASFAQMRQAATGSPLRPMPIVVLTHGQPFDTSADALGFPPEALERAWTASQAELAGLVPQARFFVAAASGHYIELQQPALVIEAIRQVVEGVRHPDTWADLSSCCAE
jgi:pimeloyl-ACP methyl ester carboxylesterase